MADFTITVEGDDMGAYIDEMRRRTDSQELYGRIAGYMYERTQDQFATEGAAFGTPWAPLSPSTVARKGDPRILFETGQMQDSISPWWSSRRAVITVPAPSGYHQRGYVNVGATAKKGTPTAKGGRKFASREQAEASVVMTPARPIFPRTQLQEDVDAIKSIIRDFFVGGGS